MWGPDVGLAVGVGFAVAAASVGGMWRGRRCLEGKTVSFPNSDWISWCSWEDKDW